MKGSFLFQFLALFLSLLLSAPQLAVALRSVQMEQRPESAADLTAGLEEESKVSGETTEELLRRASHLYGKTNPSADFLWSDEKKKLDSFVKGSQMSSGFFHKERKSEELGIPKERYDLISGILGAVSERRIRYEEGERTLETLPRLARFIILSTGKDKPLPRTIFPARVTKHHVRGFIRSPLWNDRVSGANFSTQQETFRVKLRRKYGIFVGVEKFTDEAFESAFNDIGQMINGLSSLKKMKTSPSMTKRPVSSSLSKKQSEKLKMLRQKWVDTSRELARGLVERFGVQQLIGPGTWIQIRDTGPEEGKLQYEGGKPQPRFDPVLRKMISRLPEPLTLGRLLQRLETNGQLGLEIERPEDPKTRIKFRRKPGHFVFFILVPTSSDRILLGARTKKIKQFLADLPDLAQKLFPPSSGLEEQRVDEKMREVTFQFFGDLGIPGQEGENFFSRTGLEEAA